MILEIYWKKALEQTRLSIDDESLYPLKTDIITGDLYEKNLIRIITSLPPILVNLFLRNVGVLLLLSKNL